MKETAPSAPPGDDALAILAALRRVMGYVELSTDGKFTYVNEEFTSMLGVQAEDLIGQDHRMILHPDYAHTERYDAFWKSLLAGEFVRNRMSRFGTSGNRTWMEASYNPVFAEDGSVAKIVLLGTDISGAMAEEADVKGKMAAIDRTLLVAEFMPQGKILSANGNFCKLMGYLPEELVAKEHRLFAPDQIMSEGDYRAFWNSLASGMPYAGEVTRVARDGTLRHLNASYNPIYDNHGNLEKVVEFASDITSRKLALDSVTDAIRNVRSGNLDAQITVGFDASLEPLKNDFNEMVGQLQILVNSIAAQASGVLDDSHALSATAGDLSRRTETQAATLRQTSATMEGISRNIGETAGNAAEGASLADAASADAKGGQDAVQEVIAAMASIEEVAKKISAITSLIDSIALQSRLLGLNAAVEAARAGDAGKGFAVVAAEVRSLAQKTAEAAAEIGDLVQETTGRVSAGVTLVEASGTSIAGILTSVETLRERIGQIATACNDQASAVENITAAIGELEAITQKNMTVAEQSADTSNALKSKSGELMEMIGFFDNKVPADAEDAFGRDGPSAARWTKHRRG